MSRDIQDKPPAAGLKPHVLTPTGGVAARCQAVKRDGAQCGASARSGYRVCTRHGAGLPSRERSGERKPAGRPAVHGLYSRRGRQAIADVVAELDAADVDVDDTDAEMRVLRGTLAYLLGQAEVHEGLDDTVRGVRALLEKTQEGPSVTPREAALIGHAMSSAARLLSESHSWVRAVMDVARAIVRASNLRAATRARAAEARSLEVLTRFVHVVRNILWDTLDEEQLDVLEARLVRELFIPNGLEMPDRDDPLP